MTEEEFNATVEEILVGEDRKALLSTLTEDDWERILNKIKAHMTDRSCMASSPRLSVTTHEGGHGS